MGEESIMVKTEIVSQHFEMREVNIEYVETTVKTADTLTRPLAANRLSKLRLLDYTEDETSD